MGALHVSGSFAAGGFGVAVIDFDGFTREFALNAKCVGKTGKDTFKMTVKNPHSITGQDAKFTLTLNNVPGTIKANTPFLIVVGSNVWVGPILLAK
jgi:hypothetical protein